MQAGQGKLTRALCRRGALALVAMAAAAGLGASGAARAAASLQSVLTAGNGGLGDGLGESISLDGDWLAVGAPGRDGPSTDCGAVLIFRRQGAEWAFAQELSAPGAAAYDGFGRGVALSDGLLLVGAWGDDAPLSDSGSAYILAWDGAAWTHQAKLLPSGAQAGMQFGCSVGLSAGVAVVGAFASSAAGPSSGSAYVFRRQDGVWRQEAALMASDAAAADYFGWSVAIDGGCIAVGAYGDDDRGEKSGSVYLFEQTAGQWCQAAKLAGSQTGPNARLGRQVALAGDFLVASGNSDLPGTGVYVFARDAAGWREEARLLPRPGAPGQFGFSVATDGQDVVVGAPGGAGAAYVFRRDDGGWSQAAGLVLPAGGPPGLGRSAAIRDGCAALGAATGADSDAAPGAAAIFHAGTRTAWRGNGASAGRWGDANCWTAGVPMAGMDVVIHGRAIIQDEPAVAGDVQIDPAGEGALEIDGGTLAARDLRVGPLGSLAAAAGGIIRLAGRLVIAESARTDLSAGTLRFAAPAEPDCPQGLEAACRDAGLAPAGWQDPFAIGRLVLESGCRLSLADDFDNDGWAAGPEAIYVEELVIEPGARIDLAGRSLYYRNGGLPKRLLPCDADLDGDVDAGDALVVKANLGGNGLGWLAGDADGDGDVDVLDYIALKANYGLIARGEMPPAPEPSCLFLLAAAIPSILARRRSRS